MLAKMRNKSRRIHFGLHKSIGFCTAIIGQQHERFDVSSCSRNCLISDDGLTMNIKYKANEDTHHLIEDLYPVAFGITKTTPGYVYYWRLKFIGENIAHVGVCDAQLSPKDAGTSIHRWYSYFTPNGTVLGPNDEVYMIGDKRVNSNDILDIWLDLKNDSCLMFGLNGKRFEKYERSIPVNKNVDYKLWVELHSSMEYKVELISFDQS